MFNLTGQWIRIEIDISVLAGSGIRLETCKFGYACV